LRWLKVGKALPKRFRGKTFPVTLIYYSGRDDTPGLLMVSNRKVVFVVDDDPGTLRGVKRLLGQHGYDSVLFPSAAAFQNHNDFDRAICVILDINLNDESGIEVRHSLKAQGVDLPVIYITANDSHAVRMTAMESGCVAYLTKPFSARSLIEPIEKLSAARG
jgi:FixJ family two-component response regulator